MLEPLELLPFARGQVQCRTPAAEPPIAALSDALPPAAFFWGLGGGEGGFKCRGLGCRISENNTQSF